MKTFLIVLIVLVAVIIVGWLVTRPSDVVVEEVMEEEAEAMTSVAPLPNGRYALVASESSMAWQGKRPLLEGYFDNGTVGFASGSAVVASGSLSEGSIIIDLTSIAVESTGRGDGQTKLTTDLQSEGWFNVEVYPESRFVFLSYEQNDDGTTTVTGELTIKDITNELSFPAVVRMAEGRLIMQASEILVDRTKWGLTFQSGSFFDDLGEKLIDDNFELTFTAQFELVPATDVMMEKEPTDAMEEDAEEAMEEPESI